MPSTELHQDANPAISTPQAPISPFRSSETFENYCAKVQSRLSEHAIKRIDFVQTAFDRLTRLLQTAKDVEDTSLYNEIWHHRVTAKELLESLKITTQTNSLVSPLPPRPGPPKYVPQASANSGGAIGNGQGNGNGHISQIGIPNEIGTNAVNFSDASSTAPAREQVVSQLPINHGSMENSTVQPTHNLQDDSSSNGAYYGNGSYSLQKDAIQRPPRRLRPLTDIEADAIQLREQVKTFSETHPLTTRLGDLSLPNCLTMRAFACRQRRLEDEAGETEVAEVTELMEDIVDLLDAANDQEYTIALDDEIDPQPTAYQWGELAERYEEMAQAQDSFEWWNRHRTVLTVADVQPLAEAVAAVQQKFNRLLFRLGARDPFQQQLFDELRTWAKEQQCYLHSLRPKVPMSELTERAASLVPTWDQARLIVDGDNYKQTVVENVIQLVSQADFGQDDHDEIRLQEAVWECKQQKIPSSDKRLREALLPWGAFLEGDDRFRDVLREINLEWERRQDLGKPEIAAEEADLDPTQASLWLELRAVQNATRGKRCLLLGGTCREENRRKIEDALELSELVWPSTKPSDPLSKFDTDLRHSDIVALLTRFSRKEWKNAQDICARDGKKFVHLTTGYGVAQVVRHFYTQLCPEGSRIAE